MAKQAETEGVIKYRLDHRAALPQSPDGFRELNAWRNILWRLGLIGRDAARYGGVGYGNISLRLASGFLVTGTQTGHLPRLTAEHYAHVLEAQPEQNLLRAEGPLPPSSEALTHASVYAASASVRCVVHGHCPEIWQAAGDLGLPTIAASIAYGTPAMAKAVDALVRQAPDQGVIAMLGHEDGLLSYGPEPQSAVWLLTRCLAGALARDAVSTGD